MFCCILITPFSPLQLKHYATFEQLQYDYLNLVFLIVI